MSKRFVTLALLAAFVILFTPVLSRAINVVGTSDPWLAGMPNGSTASINDSAPGQSPVLVTGLNLSSAGTVTFTVSGAVSNGPCCSANGPDGGTFLSHDTGAENGISNIVAPVNALLGVFLNANQPDTSAAPGRLDFSLLGTGFSSLAPELKQVFFIGDGLTGTGSGSVQQFTIPTGATRLFLGTMDGFEWNNNTGSFDITVNQLNLRAAQVPEPNSLLLLLLGLCCFAVVRCSIRYERA